MRIIGRLLFLAAAYRKKKNGEKCAVIFPHIPLSRQQLTASTGENGENQDKK